MVSVNFKNSANKSAAEIAATKKPSLVIDIMSSPYQVIEPSPEPVIDVYSEDEKDKDKQTDKQQQTLLNKQQQKNDEILSVIEEALEHEVEHIESHKGPCTPPMLAGIPESLDLAKGPQTPTEDPMESYDPCNPTESPGDHNVDVDDEPLLRSDSSSSSSSSGGRDELLKTAANTIPFLIETMRL